MLKNSISFLVCILILINQAFVHAQVKRRADPAPTITNEEKAVSESEFVESSDNTPQVEQIQSSTAESENKVTSSKPDTRLLNQRAITTVTDQPKSLSTTTSSQRELLRRKDIPETVSGERSGSPHHETHKGPPEMSGNSRPSEYFTELFAPNPNYGDQQYDVEKEKEIYGGKTGFDSPRPLIELGYPQYAEGPLGHSYNLFGQKNLARPQLLVYGDFRLGAAYNDNGENELGLLAARLNLDFDLKITATERLHAFIRPIDDNGKFTRVEFAGDSDDSEFEFNAVPETFFFEGDLAQIQSGLTDEYANYDLPFAFGLMPLFFQNGMWVEDEFWGAAFTIPARNSPKLDISNFDVTFFAAFDEVNSAAFLDENDAQDNHEARIYGVTTFMDVGRGYLEAGYGFVDDKDDDNGDFSYHNLTVAFTKRYFGKISNSIRFIHNFGQSPGEGFEKTADGFGIFLENSLITHKPSTLIPYFNLFYGKDKPQSLARKDGLLKNTGINFETDGLTGFPKLNDSANDSYGGAVGIEYLFNLDKQIIVEFASSQAKDDSSEDQYALGIRFQKPLSDRWIFRADAMKGWLEESDDISGIRLELRRKF